MSTEGSRISHIAPRGRILFVDAQPASIMQQARFDTGAYTAWIERALGLPHGTRNLVTVNLFDGRESLPRLDEVSAIIIGGSARSVYEASQSVTEGETFVREAVARDKPLLALCFGQQLVADALGGKVVKSPNEAETGITTIRLTDEGLRDPLFDGMSLTFEAVSSHGDAVVDLPPEARRLALSTRHANQALALGDTIRTVQFHPEITPDALAQLVLARREQIMKQRGMTPAEFSEFIAQIRQSDTSQAMLIVQNFDRHFATPSVQ